MKVALDIHKILMLKNKIYKYFFNEILKNFITILFTFTALAWVVRAVNFLDLIVEDGYSSVIYFKYSILNITTILTRFTPLAFLLSLTISIVKFERQQELLILWTTGLSKLRVVNIFLLIGFLITLFQLIMSLFVNPFLLNKSRSLLSSDEAIQMNTVLKSNDFNATFTGVTFYIDKKNSNNELQHVFIKDTNGKLNTVIDEVNKKKDSTIFAEKGFAINNKIILFNGVIQTLDEEKQIKNVLFKKTELSLANMSSRIIKHPKIQETSSGSLLVCAFDLSINLNQIKCSENFKKESIQTLSRRLGTPLYILLISIITSFLLIYKKEKKNNFYKKYVLFTFSFTMLILAEILLPYTSLSSLVAVSYFIIPVSSTVLFYLFILKKIATEKVTK